MTKAVAAGLIFAAFCGYYMGLFEMSTKWTLVNAFVITCAIFIAGRKRNEQQTPKSSS